MHRVLLFCRTGFEKDCASEAEDRFAALGWDGSAQPLEPHGLVGYQGVLVDENRRGRPPLPALSSLIFSRHYLEDVRLVSALPATDRAGPLAEALLASRGPGSYRALVLDHPDTNEGRSLAPFCKKFAPAMNNALRRMGLVFSPQETQAPALHVVFLSYEKAYVGLERAARRTWKGGIPRLKFPEDAPSRSTLKLEEAFLTLLDEEERATWLEPGRHAVDLGASPGGWTYQLLQRGYYVTAVDNGPMDSKLIASGMVDHKEEDAFHFRAKQDIDLLVCDLVEQPHKVTSLVARWFHDRHCQWAVFNLKLPMKKRYEAWEECQDRFWRESALDPSKYDLRVKHLYHDREEITLLVKPKGRPKRN